MSGDTSKTFWLGVFIIITLAVAAWLLLFLRPSVGNGGKTLHVRFSNIENVTRGTRVNYAGKPVGEVHKISEIPHPREQAPSPSGSFYMYQLELKVDSSVQVFTYDDIYFTTAGLLGEKSIAIIPKSTPMGAPPAQDISGKILYARSTDNVEEALAEITKVATSTNSVMVKVDEFLEINFEPFHETLLSLHDVSNSLNTFMVAANQENLVQRTSVVIDSIGKTMDQTNRFIGDINRSQLIGKLTSGEGTFAKLLDSDCFYLQLQGTLSKLNTMLYDINNYGLLFQYDKCWQRKRLVKEMQMRNICNLPQAMQYFQGQMNEVENNLERLEKLIYKFECGIEDPCVAKSYRELLGRVECLLESLKNYSQRMYTTCYE